MKGNVKLLETLNNLLSEELTAINQYMLHAEMCENWHYERLYEIVRKRAFTEMKHAEMLIERILFLEGAPNVSALKPMHIGKEIEAQLKNDLALEDGAVRLYNTAIAEAVELADNGTRELLESILKQEEEHVDTLEAELEQIRQIGIQNFLTEQMR
jgi:bacterioferritin